MRSPTILSTEGILNISTDYVSSPKSAAASQSTASESDTQVIEDSLKDLPQPPQSHKMASAKKRKAFDDMYDISSSPEGLLPAKRKADEDEPRQPALHKKKKTSALPQEPETTMQPTNSATGMTDEEDDDTSSEEDSDEYQPQQPKKAATLGAKLADTTTGGKLKNVRNAAPTNTALSFSNFSKLSKAPTAKKSATVTARESNQVTKDKKHVVDSTRSEAAKKPAVKATHQPTDQDDAEDSLEQDDVAEPASRKDRMKTSSNVGGIKTATVSKLTTYKASKTEVPPSKTASFRPSAQSMADKHTNEKTLRGINAKHNIAIHSSPPSDGVTKNETHLVEDRRSTKPEVIVFSKDGPRKKARESGEREETHKRKSATQTVKSTQIKPATDDRSRPAKKYVRPKDVVNHHERRSVHPEDSNIVNEHEDALAGFSTSIIAEDTKALQRNQSAELHDYASTAKDNSMNATEDVGAVADRPLPQLTGSQTAMPPPKQRKARRSRSIVRSHQSEDSETSRQRQAQHDGRAKATKSSREVGPDAAPPKVSVSAHEDNDDSGYHSTVRQAAKSPDQAAPTARMRSIVAPSKTIAANGSPLLDEVNHAAKQVPVFNPPHTSAKDTGIFQPVPLQETTEAAVTAPHGNTARQQMAPPCNDKATLAQPTSDKATPGVVNKSKHGKSPRRTFGQILDWRTTLQDHQRGLFDQLVSDAETLVSYLVHREEVIQDLVDDYRHRGKDLVKQMEILHAKEYQKYCNERDAQMARALSQ